MVIQTAVTQQQRALAFCPLEAVAVEDGVLEGRVIAVIHQNDGAAFDNFILFDVAGSDQAANVEGG